MDNNNNNNETILTHGQPALQLAQMGQMGHPLRDKTQENDALPPPTNRMVERFNQNLKLVILASYASDKTQRKKWTSMWQCTVTRHTPSREKSGANSCLTGTKLPRLPFKSRGEHHKNARKQDKEAKDLAKEIV